MVSVLNAESYYTIHKGISEKNGRVYIFYSFELNNEKLFASFSLNMDEPHEKLDTENSLTKLKTDSIIEN